MNFISRYITTCPYCHGPLRDEIRDEKEVKVCYSENCSIFGAKGRVWEAFDDDNTWN